MQKHRTAIKREAGALIRYGTVGGAAAATHFAAALVALALSVSPGIANAIGYAAGFVVSFFGQARLTFRMRSGYARALPRWFALQLSLAGFSSWGVAAASAAGVDPRLAILCAIVGVAAIGFLAGRLWVFREVG